MDLDTNDVSDVQIDRNITKWVEEMGRNLKSKENIVPDGTNTPEDLEDLLTRVESEVEKRGSRRRRQVQHLCSEMSEVLQAFMGIADIVKGVEPRAGAVLYGGLSVILMVAYKKQALEGQIIAGLRRIRAWLQALKDYDSIWQGQGRLKSLALEVSDRMMKYVLGVSKYHSEGILKRIWHAIKAPKDIAETELLALEEGIENFVNETRMLHQKTTVTIEESTRRLQQEDLERRERDDRDYLCFLRDRLGCPEIIDPKQHNLELREAQRVLASERGEVYPNPFDPPEVERFHSRINRNLKNCEEFQMWQESNHNCAILLRASNQPHHTDPRYPLWLSPALASFGAETKGGPDNSVIYHAVGTNREEIITATTAVIIYSILSWDECFRRDHKQMVENKLVSRRNQTNALDIQLDLMKDLLRQWTSQNLSKPVYIILDRVEMYLPLPGVPDRVARLEARRFIEVLVESLRVCQGKVKVCLLVNDLFWEPNIHENISDISDYYFDVSPRLVEPIE